MAGPPCATSSAFFAQAPCCPGASQLSDANREKRLHADLLVICLAVSGPVVCQNRELDPKRWLAFRFPFQGEMRSSDRFCFSHQPGAFLRVNLPMRKRNPFCAWLIGTLVPAINPSAVLYTTMEGFFWSAMASAKHGANVACLPAALRCQAWFPTPSSMRLMLQTSSEG